jgi:CheY-like chemotaxis protein
LKEYRPRCSSYPILLVEDYAPNQDVARMHLEGAGYRVEIAEHGALALKLCESKEYSLILMDIQMPEMDGFEATRRLRQRPGWTQTVVILGLSANADEKTRKECLAAGMDGLVTKPLRRASFLAEVARRLADASLEPVAGSAARQTDRADEPMDPEEATREFGGNKALLQMVLARFLNMCRIQLADMQRALSAGDAESLGREAHKIKGASANLTAMRISTAAKALEEKSQSGNLVGAEELLARLIKETEDLDTFANHKSCSLRIASSEPKALEDGSCES